MHAKTRPALAYIAGCLAHKRVFSTVYDYSGSKHIHFDGKFSGRRVDVYDYGLSCHIDGDIPDLYHYGNGSHIELKVNGAQFEGYDYKTGSHFEGKVSGPDVEIYDYGVGAYFNFSLS